MKINVLTLFPEMFDSVTSASIWARAAESGAGADSHRKHSRLYDRQAQSRRRLSVWWRPRHGAEARAGVRMLCRYRKGAARGRISTCI